VHRIGLANGVVKEQGYVEGLINLYIEEHSNACAAVVAAAINTDEGALSSQNFVGLLIIWGAFAALAMVIVLARAVGVYVGAQRALAEFHAAQRLKDELSKSGVSTLAPVDTDRCSDATAHSAGQENMSPVEEVPAKPPIRRTQCGPSHASSHYSSNGHDFQLRRRTTSSRLQPAPSDLSEPSPSSPVLTMSPTQFSPVNDNHLLPQNPSMSPYRSVHASATGFTGLASMEPQRLSMGDFPLPPHVDEKISALEAKMQAILDAFQPKQ